MQTRPNHLYISDYQGPKQYDGTPKRWCIELKSVSPVGIGGKFYVEAASPCEADVIFTKQQGPSFGSDTVILEDWHEVPSE